MLSSCNLYKTSIGKVANIYINSTTSNEIMLSNMRIKTKWEALPNGMYYKSTKQQNNFK